MIKAFFEQDLNYDKEIDGKDVRKLYVYLYYIGANNTIFNYTNYWINNLYAMFHSMLCFFLPMYIFGAGGASNILLPGGYNTDFWSMSLTMFTCVYTAVTIRIFLWTRWYTWANFVFYIFFSIALYISYIWVAEMIGLNAEESYKWTLMTH